MISATHDQVLDALRQVEDPDLRKDIVSLGFVKNVVIEGSKVSFQIELTTPACPVKDLLEQQAHDVVKALGFDEVQIEMTAIVRQHASESIDLIPGVKQCIAVASGKGGVGKSTVTVNLAVALAKLGAKVGLLDADVYGPSIPQMMGVAGEQPLTRNSKILPVERHGVSMMSMGFLLQEDQAVLWRGPMVAATVKQLLEDVQWGELDYLLVDLPPGTGDAPMSLAQLVPLTGVVLVTTPHNLASQIASKSVQLFRRLNTEILGVVENMGAFVCPSCGNSTRVFSGQSGEELAGNLNVPLLGAIPLTGAVSESGDRGIPVALDTTTFQGQQFLKTAQNLASQISIRMSSHMSPEHNPQTASIVP